MKLGSFFKVGLLILTICQFSCRKDFSTVQSSGNLRFSKDTVFLDTVFNNLSTTTQVLKVYNTSKKDILIPKIRLEKTNSEYRINVDGTSGTEFEDVLLLKKDSLFIFIEGTIASNETNSKMIYEDKILFDPDGVSQAVNLVTLVKDAVFLFNSSSTNFDLSTTTFTKTKPYVIFGNAIIPKDKTLTINAGSTVYFSKNSSLSVSKGATLNVNGNLTDLIVFRGDKLSYLFNQIPGQWQGININNAATVNINYLMILNPVTGLKITNASNPIYIKNTEIYNAGEHGIYTENATLIGENVIVGQSGKSSMYLQGGNYNFKQSTFANYWNKGIRVESTISLANYYTDSTNTKIIAPLTSANFSNCIISGNRISELSLDKNDAEPIFNFNFKNCMLKLQKGDNLYNTDNTNLYSGVLLNKKEDFRDTNINDLRIGLANQGINQADVTTSNTVPLDILGTNRTNTPDIGAYQHIDFKTLKTEDE